MPKATADTATPATEVTPEAPAKPPVKRAGLLGAGASLQDAKEYVNATWWGREGGGKTTDVLTAANRGRVLVINAEGGIKKRPLSDFGIDLANVTIWPDPTSDVEITFENLEELGFELKHALARDPESWYAVVWDSTSEIVARLLQNWVDIQVERNARQPEAKRKEARENRFWRDIADYGVVTEQVRHLVRLYRDIPCHFLMTALERRDEDQDTGRTMYGPAVNPGLQTTLLGMVDINLEVTTADLVVGPNPDTDVEPEFAGAVRTNRNSRVKDRFHALPRTLFVPTFERVLDYVEERLVEENDPIQQEGHARRAMALKIAEEHAAARAKAKQAARAAMRSKKPTEEQEG